MAVELRRRGLHLSGTPLWLDAPRKCELSFVSHAHADHTARHERVIATAPTLRFMEHRLGPLQSALPAPYRRPFELGPLVLELLPAGHILGSAQLRIIRADGERVVYTGDLALAPSLTAEAAAVADCDTLVLESTFGHPRYVFPPKTRVLDEVCEWARDAQRRGIAPVLLGYALGKSQEAILHLQRAGFAVCAHESICEMAELYRSFGVPLGPIRPYDGTWLPEEVVFFPPHKARFGGLGRLRARTTAALTGWALDGPRAFRYGADRAFPVSDHADFPSLIEYALATGAREVLTHHGFAKELAEGLRAHGVHARPVGTVHQNELFTPDVGRMPRPPRVRHVA